MATGNPLRVVSTGVANVNSFRASGPEYFGLDKLQYIRISFLKVFASTIRRKQPLAINLPGIAETMVVVRNMPRGI